MVLSPMGARYAGVLRRHAIVIVALAVALILVHPLIRVGVIGYAYDWNVPASPSGMWAWGIADLNPWRPIEYGMPLAYPTELYLKLAFAVLGLLHVPASIAVALFLFCCYSLAFVGAARAVRSLFDAGTRHQLVVGLLYVASPFMFNTTVAGYITGLVAAAAFPWVIVSLYDATHGCDRAWLRFAFWCAVSMAQIQYAVFDLLVAAVLLIAAGASLRSYVRAVFTFGLGVVGCYLFIFPNLLLVHNEYSTVVALSRHSWTELQAPGLFRALAQQPSFYSFFHDSLKNAAWLWTALGILLTVGGIVIALRSPSRFARAFAAVAIVALLFLNGSNPPFGFAISALYAHFPPMAFLRNINYLYAVLALVIPLLWAAPTKKALPRRYLYAFAVIAVLWTLPFWTTRYTSWIPVTKNEIPQVVGASARELVWPHLSVLKNDVDAPSGVNPNSIETITPIFVRDTPTGVLEASLLDRVTDWAPVAKNFVPLMRTGQISSVDLQLGLDSHFPQFVNSYADQWLFDAYDTSNLRDRLTATGVYFTQTDGLVKYGEHTRSDAAAADGYALLDGGLQGEAALMSMGFELPVVSAADLDTLDSLAVSPKAFIREGDSMPTLLSKSDYASGDAVSAGALTSRKTADFHEDWVDLMQSQNWWLSSRLLQSPHAAVTTSRVMLSVPLPHHRVHVRLQYFASNFGGVLKIGPGRPPLVIKTSAATFGEYRWVDVGWFDGASIGALTIQSDYGLNAIGAVAMLSPEADKTAALRYRKASRLPSAIVLPDLSFPSVSRFRVDTGRMLPVLTGSAHPDPVSFDARLIRSQAGCEVRISNVRLVQYEVTIDGRREGRSGYEAPLTKFPCLSSDIVEVDGRRLGPIPIRAQSVNGSLEVKRYTASASNAVTRGIADFTVHPDILPLAFPALGPGIHTVALSSSPLVVPGRDWVFEDSQRDETDSNTATGTSEHLVGATILRFVSNHHIVDMNIPLKKITATDAFVVAGAYQLDQGAQFRITIYDPEKNRILKEMVLPYKRTQSTFVLRLGKIQAEHAFAYVYFSPRSNSESHGRLSWAEPLRDQSANLVLISTGFPAGSLRDVPLRPLKFDRYAISAHEPVLQYAQTYDTGWTASHADEHLVTPSGFNLWLFPNGQRAGSVTIRYRTGVIYAILVAVSSLILASLALWGFVPIRVLLKRRVDHEAKNLPILPIEEAAS